MISDLYALLHLILQSNRQSALYKWKSWVFKASQFRSGACEPRQSKARAHTFNTIIHYFCFENKIGYPYEWTQDMDLF